jgi:hypothetical protein
MEPGFGSGACAVLVGDSDALQFATKILCSPKRMVAEAQNARFRSGMSHPQLEPTFNLRQQQS